MSPSYYLQLFNRIAPNYWIAELVSFGLFGIFRKRAIGRAAIRKGSTVLDLMCGTGNNVNYLRTDIRYVGLDISEAMMSAAQTKYGYLPNTTFSIHNVVVPCKSGLRADHIISSYGLKCIAPKDYPAFALSIEQMLKAGGTFSIVDFQIPDSSILKLLLTFYINAVYKPICYLLSSDVTPAVALLDTLAQPIQPESFVQILQAQGMDVNLKKCFAGAVIFIFGRKKSSNTSS